MNDMTGGTFTISNSGIWGSLFGTPIINMPQTAVLGIYGIQERPVVVNGQVEIRPVGSKILLFEIVCSLIRADDVYRVGL